MKPIGRNVADIALQQKTRKRIKILFCFPKEKYAYWRIAGTKFDFEVRNGGI